MSQLFGLILNHTNVDRILSNIAFTTITVLTALLEIFAININLL